MIINGYSDKTSDIVISLLLGLIPAYLFHLIYKPKYVLVEEKSMISDNKIIYKKCRNNNCKCFKLKKNKRCDHTY
jgi:hypothetical protein